MSARTPRHGFLCILLSLLAPAGRAAPPTPAAEAPAKVQLRGTVVDEKGRPVAGAVVSGSVVVLRRQGRITFGHKAPFPELTTDADGAFHVELTGRAADLTVRIQARHKNAFTARQLELQGEALEKPLTLTVSSRNARGLRVRVIDEEGKPVAGAALTIRHQSSDPSARQVTPVQLNRESPASDRQGCFEAPSQLDPDGLYQIVVKAEGFPEDRTLWKEPAAAPILDFGNVILRRPHALQGQVLDRQGKPVAGARVLHIDGRNRVETVTDDEGRFKLTPSFFPPGFLFVDRAGFRFHGQRCQRPEPVKITLVCREEKATRKMATLPPALPRGERKKLAARLLEPVLRNTQDREDSARLWALQTLGLVDPGRLLEELERKPLRNASYDAYVRRGAVEGLLAEAPEEARTVVASLKDPDGRTRAYLEMCDALPRDKRKEKLELLDQAVVHAHGIENSGRRLVSLGDTARRLWRLGEKERATKLLREGQEIARQLPTSGAVSTARAAFAEDLALIDLDAALELLKGVRYSPDPAVYHGNLARKIAGSDPAAAEHVFNSLLEVGGTPSLSQYDRDRYAPQVCYHMAPADLPRARKLADTVSDPYIKARTLGVMAHALARRRPKEARALLEQAQGVLEKQVASGKDRFNGRGSAALLAGLLVPVAEEIDADLTAEYFWRALSLYTPALPRQASTGALGIVAMQLGGLALVLARYDRDLGMVLAEEARAATPGMIPNHMLYLKAAALADPRRAVAFVEELPEGKDKDSERVRVVILMLAEGQAVGKNVHTALSLWFADDDDF